MREQFSGHLTRALDDGTISRRRALKLVGGALLAAMGTNLFATPAEAARRRVRLSSLRT